MAQQSVFAREWRECLQAHYLYVIRIHDRLTEGTLIAVMRDAGFSDAELAELRVRATMHIDDVGADFVPDSALMAALEQTPDTAIAAEAQPQEPLAQDAQAEDTAESVPNDEYYAPPDDTPRQLSLF